jgi:hypothetical protein
VLLRRYGVSTMVGDHYAGEWPRARFAEHGIELVQSARPKSALYGDLLPLLNARRVELLDLPRLSAQLAGLERRVARSGKDSIDHGPGGHDDLANAVAGVLVGLDLDRRPPLVRLEDVVDRDGQAPLLPVPAYCTVLFAVIAVAESSVAVVYACSRPEFPALHILDVDASPFYGGFFADVADRLRRVLPGTKALAAGVFAPASLARHLARFELIVAETPEWFDPEQSLIFAAHVASLRRVRFAAAVIEKMKVREIGAALAFRAGDPVETSLRTALIAAICLKFDEQLTNRPRAS